MRINENIIGDFRDYLIGEEKAKATVSKYIHDVMEFALWLGEREPDKQLLLEYKERLRSFYKPVSINAAIASLNSFLCFIDRHDLRLKTVKIQRRIYADTKRELKKHEYKKLLAAAEKKANPRLSLIIRTMAATGVRVSELRFITAEAVMSGTAEIECKGKLRLVFIPKDIQNLLKRYMRSKNITSGSVFITRNGNPVDRSNISKEMKRAAKAANISPRKVFPHNLRHFFARTFYGLYKDIVRLADALGHSSINTTRIYTMESGDAHRKRLNALSLAVC